MSFFYALLLGILQGFTEFLPVSSFGHIVSIEKVLGLNGESGLLFESLLHMGSLAALILFFRKDLHHIMKETGGILYDLLQNLKTWMTKSRRSSSVSYHQVMTTPYRRLTAMMIASSIPTFLLGIVCRRLASMAKLSSLMPGSGMLLTAVFLIVVDLSRAGGHKSPKNAEIDTAIWIGISQGLSVFPGVSRLGLTAGTGLFCGFSRNMALRYSYLISIPAIFGAVVIEFPLFWQTDLSVSQGILFVFGMIISAIVGFFSIRFMMNLTKKIPFRYFAIYCFLAGAVMLAVNFS